jgi:hypothetical protein
MSRVRLIFHESGEVAEYTLASEHEADQRLWRAIRLSPSVDICEALLHGEAVPADRLDPEWVARFGRRAA